MLAADPGVEATTRRLPRRALLAPFFAGAIALVLVALPGARLLAQESLPTGEAPTPTGEGIELVRIRSELLSAYWGREIHLEAGVVLPPDHALGRRWATAYDIHGFGGSHRVAWNRGPQLRKSMREDGYPPMLYVFLNGSCPQGHHEFADSVNNGPWGEALLRELIPEIERRFGADPRPRARFLTGHSSGGWSSLWLQVAYPDAFGGAWSIAPDPVDFRDFTGIDVYGSANAYVNSDGKEIPLVRQGKKWVLTIKGYCEREFAEKPYGGQFSSFNYVFSPRGESGAPLPLFDVKTGVIDRKVADAWRRYDISLILRERWAELGPKLMGKLRVFCGLEDTFRLEGPLLLLRSELERLGSDAEIIFVEGRDHGSVLAPHELWPRGLLDRIHREMWAHYRFIDWVQVRTVPELRKSA